jgi:hypothetical protein
MLNGLLQVPAHELGVSIHPFRVLETTYFLAAPIVRAKGCIQGSIQSSTAPVCAGDRHAASIIS